MQDILDLLAFAVRREQEELETGERRTGETAAGQPREGPANQESCTFRGLRKRVRRIHARLQDCLAPGRLPRSLKWCQPTMAWRLLGRPRCPVKLPTS